MSDHRAVAVTGRGVGDRAGVDLAAPPQSVHRAVRRRRGVEAHLGGRGLDGGLEVGRGQRNVGWWPVGTLRSVQADRGVDMDDPAGLELHHLGVGDLASSAELRHRQLAPFGQVALQGDAEPAPQLRGVPLPHDVAGVVVAVRAQRLAQPRVVLVVALAAPGRTAVRAQRLVATSPAGPLGAQPVHSTERRGGQGGERPRVVGHRLRDALAAGQPAHDHVPGVALVLPRTRRTDRRATVAAPHVGVAIQLISRRVRLTHLPGLRVDHRRGAHQSDRTRTAPGPLLGRVLTGLPERKPEVGDRSGRRCGGCRRRHGPTRTAV
jgi:hypothetical protein